MSTPISWKDIQATLPPLLNPNEAAGLRADALVHSMHFRDGGSSAHAAEIIELEGGEVIIHLYEHVSPCCQMPTFIADMLYYCKRCRQALADTRGGSPWI